MSEACTPPPLFTAYLESKLGSLANVPGRIHIEGQRLCREGFFILPYNELAIAQGPKIYQKKEL
jgi:hypothetical protein